MTDRLEAREAEVEPVVQHRPGERDRRRVAVDRRSARSPDRPGTRDRGSGPPCRTPRRRRRRSSARAGGTRPAPRISTSIVWPPDTSSTTIGNSIVGSSSKAAYRWASRWLTPTNGTSHASASALAADTPTSSAPISPGPIVHATASMRCVLDAGLDDRPGDHRVEQVEVGAAGDLGHDAAERRVQVDLRADDARHDVAAAHHERRRRLVAARLDAEHERVRADVDRVDRLVVDRFDRSATRSSPSRVARRRPASRCRGTT